MTKTLIGTMLAMLVACAPTAPAQGPSTPRCDRTYTLDPDFTVRERELINSANDEWNSITGNGQQFCVVDDGIWPIRKIQHYGEIWQSISIQNHGADILGAHHGGIEIVDDLEPSLFRRVVLHELGHAHGLKHIIGPAAIMNPFGSTAQDLTTADIIECERVKACYATQSSPRGTANH